MSSDEVIGEVMNAVEHLVKSGGNVSIKQRMKCMECNRMRCWCNEGRNHEGMFPIITVSTTLEFIIDDRDKRSTKAKGRHA